MYDVQFDPCPWVRVKGAKEDRKNWMQFACWKAYEELTYTPSIDSRPADQLLDTLHRSAGVALPLHCNITGHTVKANP